MGTVANRQRLKWRELDDERVAQAASGRRRSPTIGTASAISETPRGALHAAYLRADIAGNVEDRRLDLAESPHHDEALDWRVGCLKPRTRRISCLSLLCSVSTTLLWYYTGRCEMPSGQTPSFFKSASAAA